MTNSMYPWQQEAWQQLQQLRVRLPHAILLHGAEGIGKTAFAEQFAQALLCEAPADDGHACGTCPSCGWFLQYSHPDYRRGRAGGLAESGARDTEQAGARGAPGWRKR